MYVNEVAELLSALTVPWWIAGGWAIDLFVGHQTRFHQDTDVLIRRDDQLIIQHYLSGWDLHKTNQPGLKPWPKGEFLTLGVNQVWCRVDEDSPWCLELMLLETENDDWVYRRNPKIRAPLFRVGSSTASGIPYLAPEIQLLYKARRVTLAKDQQDFDISIPRITEEARKWLLSCLEMQFPDGHEWVTALRK